MRAATYRGTTVGIRRQYPWTYQCERCGIHREFSGGRKRPARCLDCRGIDPWVTERRAS